MTNEEMIREYAKMQLIIILAQEIRIKKEISFGLATEKDLARVSKRRDAYATDEKIKSAFDKDYFYSLQEGRFVKENAEKQPINLQNYNSQEIRFVDGPISSLIPAYNQEEFFQLLVEEFRTTFLPTQKEIDLWRKGASIEDVFEEWASSCVKAELKLKGTDVSPSTRNERSNLSEIVNMSPKGFVLQNRKVQKI